MVEQRLFDGVLGFSQVCIQPFVYTFCVLVTWQLLQRVMVEQGPFDGVVGFSQVCFQPSVYALVCLLCGSCCRE